MGMSTARQDGPVTTSMPQLALLASPLLGPAVWRPAAVALHGLGWRVLLVPRSMEAPRQPQDVREHLLSDLPAEQQVAVVAHSNAGLYVPALAAERPVVATVFADAALPPAAGSTFLAPVGMHRFLEDLADPDGLLPPWTQWWDEQQLAPLFPDSAARAAVESEQHRLPLGYFTATLNVPAGWAERPAAYLAFGDTYQAEREQAKRWGWPVRTMLGEHLHPLMDPTGVAAALDDLLRELLQLSRA